MNKEMIQVKDKIYPPKNNILTLLDKLKQQKIWLTNNWTLTFYWLGTDGLPNMFTILFNKFKPNTVSSQFTLTVTCRGSKHLPSTVSETKHGIELLRISALNRRHRPVASSRKLATGSSMDTKKMFALASIFSAKLLQMRRNLSSSIGLSFFSSFNFSRWSLNVHLKNTVQPS